MKRLAHNWRPMALRHPTLLWTCLACGKVCYDARRECYGCEPERGEPLPRTTRYEGKLPEWEP